MQFNPACLNGGPQQQHINTPSNVNQEFLNSLNQYTDVNAGNGWNYGGLPLYGLYNQSLVNVPQPDVSQQVSDAKKKSPAKRTPPPSGAKIDEPADHTEMMDDKCQGMDEEQKQKRQRRLLKNREAAQQFRQRQKEYIQNLERRVSELTNLVGESHKHIELLNTENRLLRDQLVYLYNVMRQNLSATSPASSPSFANLSNQSIASSPAPSLPTTTPVGLIDLGMLGFKGYGMVEPTSSFEEMLKHNPSTAQFFVPPPLTPLTSPGPTPNASPAPSPAPSPMVSPMISPRMPDMGTLSLAKEMDNMMTDGMANQLLMARFGNYAKSAIGALGGDHNNEAQTVPELIIKAEGGSGSGTM